MSARWVELVARECPGEFKQDIEAMIASENKLDRVSNADDLQFQRGKVKALQDVLFKVTSTIDTTKRR